MKRQIEKNTKTAILPVKMKYKSYTLQQLLFIAYVISAALSCFGFTLICSGQPCNFTNMPNFTRYSKIDSWFTIRSIWLTLGYVTFILLSLHFPYFGKEAILPGSKRLYVANGFFSFFIILIVTFGLEKYVTSISDIVHEDYVQLCLLWMITSMALSVFLFIKGRHATEDNKNPKANGEKNIYDFFIGREISPFTNKIHYKVCLFRFGVIGLIIFNFLWLYRSLSNGNLQTFEFNTTLIVYALIEILYGMYFLYFEADNSWTFEYMCESVGLYFAVAYSFYPFFTPSITKLILDQNIQLPNNTLVFMLITYIIGLYINYASNYEKNLFRKDPKHADVAHLRTIPTSNGNRLIISGWWGLVRHPNYLGDIIIQFLYIFPTYGSIVIYIVIFEIVLLVHRAIRDGKRCSERYGTAWKQYCQKVPYTLIPWIW